MRTRFSILIIGSIVVGLAAAAQATPLGLTLADHPDIMSSFIDITYTQATQHFVATGFAGSFNDDGIAPDPDITDLSGFSLGDFLIDATIDNSGNAISATLTINGYTLTYGPSLLTGTLASAPSFGWFDHATTGDFFEFKFYLTGGGLGIPAYFGTTPGPLFGVILRAPGSNFANSWNVDWGDHSFNAVSDTAPIPEPTSLGLGAAATIGLLSRRGRRQAN